MYVVVGVGGPSRIDVGVVDGVVGDIVWPLGAAVAGGGGQGPLRGGVGALGPGDALGMSVGKCPQTLPCAAM